LTIFSGDYHRFWVIYNGDGKTDIFRYLPYVSGADVFLSQALSPLAIPSVGNIMRAETVQSLTELSESEESALLIPFIEAMKRGEHRSVLNVKKAYQQKARRMITRAFVNRLLNKHGFWEKATKDGKVSYSPKTGQAA
jgi:hypothetical protein